MNHVPSCTNHYLIYHHTHFWVDWRQWRFFVFFIVFKLKLFLLLGVMNSGQNEKKKIRNDSVNLYPENRESLMHNARMLYNNYIFKMSFVKCQTVDRHLTQTDGNRCCVGDRSDDIGIVLIIIITHTSNPLST